MCIGPFTKDVSWESPDSTIALREHKENEGKVTDFDGCLDVEEDEGGRTGAVTGSQPRPPRPGSASPEDLGANSRMSCVKDGERRRDVHGKTPTAQRVDRTRCVTDVTQPGLVGWRTGSS